MIPKFEIKLPNGLILSVEGDPNRSWKVKPESESQLALKMAEAIATADWPAVVSLYGSKTAKAQASLEVSREQQAAITATAPRRRAAQPTLTLDKPIQAPAPTPQQPPATESTQQDVTEVPANRPRVQRQTPLKAVTDLLSKAQPQEKSA